MINKFAEQYRRQFLEASGGVEPASRPMALKGLEEYVEFCFAAGVPPHQIEAVVQQAVIKEVARGTKPSIVEAVKELCDVRICLRIYAGLAGISSAEIHASTEDKHAINGLRPQRVNEFGSLSHKKD
jgi:hypothetical protein